MKCESKCFTTGAEVAPDNKSSRDYVALKVADDSHKATAHLQLH